MLTHCAILGGGGGNRLWPLSKPNKPKQFLSLFSDESMLRETIDRILPVSDGSVSVVAPSKYSELVKKSLCGYNDIKFIKEPAMKNTAAAVGLAAFAVRQAYGDGVLCVFPADHYIRSAESFLSCVSHAVKLCECSEAILTIGIRPDHASTAYGYLKCGAAIDAKTQICERFVEKPDEMTARIFLENGSYLWNSGIFIFRTDVMMREIMLQMPKLSEMFARLESIYGTKEYEEALTSEYSLLENKSIDYGIMENASKVYAIKGDFEWSDLGSFDMLSKLYKSDESGNRSKNSSIFFDSKECFAYSDSRRIVTIGIEDLCVVDDGENILICNKSRSKDLGKYVNFVS